MGLFAVVASLEHGIAQIDADLVFGLALAMLNLDGRLTSTYRRGLGESPISAGACFFASVEKVRFNL